MPSTPFAKRPKTLPPEGLLARTAPGLSLLARALKNTVFPSTCLGCQEMLHETTFFCPQCAAEIQTLADRGCRICGRPFKDPIPDGVCPDCLSKPPDFDQAWALAVYNGPLGDAVRRFKYHRHWATGAALAAYLAERASGELPERFDILAPVPLHPRRLLTRGFNQAAVLGRDLARNSSLALVPGLLKRLRHTRPQVGLDPSARRQNVAGAFAVDQKKRSLPAGAGVLVLDDVFTTGATVNECARVLKQAGAVRVGVLTLVRAASGDLLADRPPVGYDRTQERGPVDA